MVLVVKPYYEDERAGIRLFHADNREVLPALPDGSVSLVFTSPPYNNGICPDTNGGPGGWKTQSPVAKGRRFRDGYGAFVDQMPPAEYEAWQRETLTHLWRVTAADGAIFYNHRPRVWCKEIWTPLCLNPGLPLRQIIIWDRGNGISLGDRHFCGAHEWILLFAKPEWALRNRAASALNDLWRVPWQPERGGHPAPFPVALPARALEATDAADVLDPYAGTGTTLVAAKRLGRRAIGFEVEERWCEVAAKRLQQEVLPLGASSDLPEPRQEVLTW